MTDLVRYHSKTNELALFVSNGTYWIGSYSPFMRHTNDEPDYIWIAGDWDNEKDGLNYLTQMTGDEF